eukprot:scaffold276649_cov14-Tisochrysis_lutea.AAC.1
MEHCEKVFKRGAGSLRAQKKHFFENRMKLVNESWQARDGCLLLGGCAGHCRENVGRAAGLALRLGDVHIFDYHLSKWPCSFPSAGAVLVRGLLRHTSLTSLLGDMHFLSGVHKRRIPVAWHPKLHAGLACCMLEPGA